MWPRRSLARVAAAVGCTTKNLEPFSAKFRWSERADLYDFYLARRLQE
jgi:hypothetical protein